MSNTYRAELRRRRLAKGLCGRCGQHPLVNNSTLCEECRAYYHERWKNRSPELIAKHKEAVKKWAKNHPELRRLSAIRYLRKLRKEVIEHYGGKCSCCGENNHAFLTIDHINGKGNIHRRKLFGKNIAGNTFYKWLRVNKFPEGFQVLCYNCNMAKAHLGVCPHTIK